VSIIWKINDKFTCSGGGLQSDDTVYYYWWTATFRMLPQTSGSQGLLCDCDILQTELARTVCLWVCHYFTLVQSSLNNEAASFSEILVFTDKNRSTYNNRKVEHTIKNHQTKSCVINELRVGPGWDLISKSIKKYYFITSISYFNHHTISSAIKRVSLKLIGYIAADEQVKAESLEDGPNIFWSGCIFIYFFLLFSVTKVLQEQGYRLMQNWLNFINLLYLLKGKNMIMRSPCCFVCLSACLVFIFQFQNTNGLKNLKKLLSNKFNGNAWKAPHAIICWPANRQT
jgi:hypothetical protein